MQHLLAITFDKEGDKMENVKNNELFSEKIAAWLTILEDVKFEQIRLKNLLAEAISKNVSRKFVEEAEAFQQKFLDKEQVVELLRHDIISMMTNKSDVVRTGLLFNSLERDMLRLQAEIATLKALFYQYLESNEQ